jgi:hypothetical protein
MKKVYEYNGSRLATGWHTGVAVYERDGKYYVSTESGTRLATKRERDGWLLAGTPVKAVKN